MRHPSEKHNQSQAELLAMLPEAQREPMARLFRIGNASYVYHSRAAQLEAWAADESNLSTELLTIYFEEYLTGLPDEGIRSAERARGIDEVKRSLPFRRYLLERHDVGYDEFLQNNLSPEDYAYHLECGKPLE